MFNHFIISHIDIDNLISHAQGEDNCILISVNYLLPQKYRHEWCLSAAHCQRQYMYIQDVYFVSEYK